MKKPIILDEERAMALYMAGLSDVMIGKSVGASSYLILKWRNKNELPSNVGLFNWQEKYEGEIPERYRKPKVSK